MNKLGRIRSKTKSGDESLIYNESKLDYKLIDFWKWCISDLISNATRGRLAEFIVATAANVDLSVPREEWQSYDLITQNGIKLEIKSAAYIQSWNQKELSKISFSIKPARGWDEETGIQSDKPERHADVYVMCLLNHCNQATINPLDLSQWKFYVLSTFEIDNYQRSQHSITLNSLERLTTYVTYDKLADEIKKKHEINTNHKNPKKG